MAANDRTTPNAAPTAGPVPLEVDGEVRVTTTASVWLVRPDSYCRMPRSEGPRAVSSPALTDGTWHAHVGAFLVSGAQGSWLRLMPPGRDPGASGVETGLILASSIPGVPAPPAGASTEDPAPGSGVGLMAVDDGRELGP